LIEVGREEEAKEAVFYLHGKSDEDRAAAEKEFGEMYSTIKAESAMRSRKISDLWASKAMIHRTLVACGVQVFCQFTGINGISDRIYRTCLLTLRLVINYFGPQMYASLGITGSRALLVQGYAQLSTYRNRTAESYSSIYGAVGPIANFL
jgi:hypothetical protein